MPDLREQLQIGLGREYALERELGSGGMATVYLAHDRKHDRPVAVKVLHADLAAALGAERFLQEIKVTAHLQHPHILGLIDSGMFGADAGALAGRPYYVMPYVDGESLRQRLEREQHLPVAEAVRLATEVAAALDYAHRHGVVHRDVKPENILLHDGSALVADFGIALAVQQAGGPRMTQTGLSLGTPQYMSPEQAAGDRHITARADVWALGAVLYEMLAGEPPFTGPTMQVIVARVIHEAPRPLTAQRHSVPPHVEAAVLRALEKVPADRFGSAAELAAALAGDGRWAMSGGLKPLQAHRPPPHAHSLAVPWLIAALSTAVAAGALLWTRARPAAEPLGRHYDIALPDSAPLVFVGGAWGGGGQTALALSPDGRTLVYVGRAGAGATTRLYVRGADEFTFRGLAGTEGAFTPFFSPDGASVGFFAGGRLKRVALATGQVTALAEVAEPSGGAWDRNGRIVFVERLVGKLSEVPASGGAKRSTSMLRGEYPALLPGERRLLVQTATHLAVRDRDTTRQVALGLDGPVDEASRDAARVMGFAPRWLASGHLAYSAGGTLMVAPFDAEGLRLLRPPVPAVTHLRTESMGAAQYAVADDGTLAYVPGADVNEGVLLWAGRGGRLDTLPFPSANYIGFSLSPDERRILARTRGIGGEYEIWILDLDGGSRLRIYSSSTARVRTAIWAQDGRSVLAGVASVGLLRLAADGSGAPDTLDRNATNPMSLTPDGRQVAVGGIQEDLRLIALDGRTPPRAVVSSAGGGAAAAISPDGRWIAYTRIGTGVVELYVQPLVGGGVAMRVAGDGADEPVWSKRGDLLYYRTSERFVAVPFRPGSPPTFGAPVTVAEGPFGAFAGLTYDVAADGRLLLKLGPQEQTARTIRVVTNWFGELRRLTAAGK